MSDSNEQLSEQKTPSPSTESRSDYSILLYTIAALGIALFIRFFVAAPYIVSGSSMEPTFYDMHYLIVDKVTYRLSEPKRGDVIVLDLPQDTSRALIKRVVGLPGETVVLNDTKVTIENKDHPNGFTLTEPYIAAKNQGGSSGMRVALGPNEYFVMGDNRHVSADSRIWGKLPKSDIVGRVILRLYPFTLMGVTPGEARYANEEHKAQPQQK